MTAKPYSKYIGNRYTTSDASVLAKEPHYP